jgi:hypothetical protein
MAREVLAVTDIIRATPGNPGVLVAASAANNAEFANDGRTILCVLNTATACNITLITQSTVDGQAVADPVIAVGIHATQVTLIGPFPPGIYNNDDGDMEIDIDDDTSVSLGAFRLPVG